MKVLQGLALIVGLGLLAATAHVIIEANGGYGTLQATLMMAHAVGVGVGALCIGALWFSGRRRLAVWLFGAMVAGELFGVVSLTATAQSVRRERAALEEQQRALDRVEKAWKVWEALKAPPEPSQRLKDALDRKTTADAAVVENSAKEGCAANCRELLQAQANAANGEVEQARAEMQLAYKAAKEAAENELDAAYVDLKEHMPSVSIGRRVLYLLRYLYEETGRRIIQR